MAHDPPESPATLTVYFDGACPVCSREIAWYRRQHGAQDCAWVDASACGEADLGQDLDRADALARLHVRLADGTLVGGTRGFVALWQALPRTSRLGRVAAWGPMPALLERAYRLFLRLRPLWYTAPSRARTPGPSSAPIPTPPAAPSGGGRP